MRRMPNTAGVIILRAMVNCPLSFKEGMLDEANAEYSWGDDLACHGQLPSFLQRCPQGHEHSFMPDQTTV